MLVRYVKLSGLSMNVHAMRWQQGVAVAARPPRTHSRHEPWLLCTTFKRLLLPRQHGSTCIECTACHAVHTQVLWTRITNRHTHGQAKLIRVQKEEGLIGGCAAEKQQLALCLTVRCLWEPYHCAVT